MAEIDTVFRDHVVKGDIHSGTHEPDKAEIRSLLKQIQDVSGQAVTRNTLTALQAVTPPNENYMGVVLTGADAGYYSRSGGAWVFGRGFPDTIAVFTQTGGTANALQLAAAAGVNPSDVVVGIVVPNGTNTGSATIAINGGAAVPLLSAAGAPLGAGELVGDKATIIAKVEGDWRVVLAYSQFTFRSAWNSATNYVGDDIVQYGGSLWLANRQNVNVAPVEGADWTLFLPGVTVADGSVTEPKHATGGVSRRALNEGTSTSIVYSVIERGAAGDGVTNDASAIDAAQAAGPLHFTAGTYLIQTALNITETATFEPGAVIVVDGVTLTLSGDIIAGSYQIFDVVNGGVFASPASTSALSEIRAEWFPGSKVGNSTITRGRGAGHAVMNGSGLSGLDYNHIDGFLAARDTATGLEGMAIGTYAGTAAASLLHNTLVGYAAGRGEQISGLNFRGWTGEFVTVLGSGTLVDILAGSSITAIGAGAMKEFETGNFVTAVGANASRLGTVKQNSVFVGTAAAYNVGTTGALADNTDTVAIGHNALNNATESYRNTIVGALSGTGLITGRENTVVGRASGAPSGFGTVSRSISIGNAAATRVDDSITIGNGITETVAGRIQIGGAAQTATLVAGIYGNTTATAANVVVGSSGLLQRSTSSSEFKTEIEPLSDEWANKVLELEPVYYRSTCEADNPEWGWYGLIAEDAAKIDPRFATWGHKPLKDENGSLLMDDLGQVVLDSESTPNGVPYDRLVVNLLAVVKRQRKEIAELAQRLNSLEAAVKR